MKISYCVKHLEWAASNGLLIQTVDFKGIAILYQHKILHENTNFFYDDTLLLLTEGDATSLVHKAALRLVFSFAIDHCQAF